MGFREEARLVIEEGREGQQMFMVPEIKKTPLVITRVAVRNWSCRGLTGLVGLDSGCALQGFWSQVFPCKGYSDFSACACKVS